MLLRSSKSYYFLESNTNGLPWAAVIMPQKVEQTANPATIQRAFIFKDFVGKLLLFIVKIDITCFRSII